MNKKRIFALAAASILSIGLMVGCDEGGTSTDSKQASQTAQLQAQSSSKLGMPNITNFYEKQTLKTIMEECDKANLITYVYTKSEMTGKFVYLGEAIGYGVPYGTEYTNPEYIASSYEGGYAILPQPDPNGLYKATNVDATWIMLIDPTTKQAKPQYIEDKVDVYSYKLDRRLCDPTSLPTDY